MDSRMFRNVSGALVPFLLSAFSVFSLSMVIGQLSSYFHVPVSSILIAVPLDFIGGAAGSIFIGRVSDRVGRRPMMMLSVLIFSLSLISASFMTDFYELLVIWFIMGIGVNSQNGISYPLLVETLKRTTGTIGGLMQGLYFIGFLLDSLFFIEIRYWRTFFLISGIFALALSAISSYFIVETGPRGNASRSGQSGVRAIFSKELSGLTAGLIIIGIAAFMLSVPLLSVVPTIVEELKISEYYIVVLSLIGFFGFILAGYLSDKFQKWAVTLSFASIALISGALLFVESNVFYVPLVLMLSFISAGFFGFIGVWVSQTYSREIRGAATNIVFLFGRVLGGLSPFITALIVPQALRLGLSAMIMISAIIAIAGSLIFWLASRMRS